MSTEPGTIYVGGWINWSRGHLLGATWTIPARYGAQVSNFFSIFITSLIGSQLWVIVSFVIYQFSVATETDTLRRQHQVLLRNSGSAGGTALELFFLPFSWHQGLLGQGKKEPALWFYLRSWRLAALPAVIFGGFLAAGTLATSIIGAASDEALIYGSHCGEWTFSDNPRNTQQRQLFETVLNETYVAANYARYCYGSPSTSSLCNTYITQQISWKTNQAAPCPFASGTCMFSDTAALQFDTGLIDSHFILGVNSPAKDRVFYRRVTTCAPLNTTGRIETTRPDGLSLAYRYYFGSVFNSNYTLNYWYILVFYEQGYYLDAFASEAGSPDESWIPSSDLSLDDADVTLFSLAPNLIAYLGPIRDPFFAATQWTSGGYVAAIPYELVHFLGCADQHQFCKSNDFDQCTALTGFRLLNNSLNNIPWTPVQRAVMDRIRSTLNFSQIYHSVAGRGAEALLANEKVTQTVSDVLPDNQWTIELGNWFATSLARLQHAMVEYAAGPFEPPSEMIILPPKSKQDSDLCHAQIVRATGSYQSFSILALALVSGFGVLIIAVSFTLERLAQIFQQLWKRGGKKGKERLLRWTMDGKLQMMRMAYEYIGIGEWLRKEHSTPITKELGPIFKLPENLDPKAPSWGQPQYASTQLSILTPQGRPGTSPSFTTDTSSSSNQTTRPQVNALNTGPGVQSAGTARQPQISPAQPPATSPAESLATISAQSLAASSAPLLATSPAQPPVISSAQPPRTSSAQSPLDSSEPSPPTGSAQSPAASPEEPSPLPAQPPAASLEEPTPLPAQPPVASPAEPAPLSAQPPETSPSPSTGTAVPFMGATEETVIVEEQPQNRPEPSINTTEPSVSAVGLSTSAAEQPINDLGSRIGILTDAAEQQLNNPGQSTDASGPSTGATEQPQNSEGPSAGTMGSSGKETRPAEQPTETTGISNEETRPAEKPTETIGNSDGEIGPAEQPTETSRISDGETRPAEQPTETSRNADEETRP